MIAVFTKCTIYEDYDHDRYSHKNFIFLSLYMIAIMIAVLTKMSFSEFLQDCKYDRSFLYQDYDHDHSIHKNVLYLSFYEDYDYDRTPRRTLQLWSQFSQKCPIFEFL